MSLRQTAGLKVYGSRGGIHSTHKTQPQEAAGHDGVAAPVALESRSLEGPKPSISFLKRKSTATTNLHSFFGSSQPTKKTKLVGHPQKPSSFKQSANHENVVVTPALTQLHFLPSKSILVTITSSSLFTGRSGMEWSREERGLEKPLGTENSDVELIEERCILPNGVVGRILRIRCDVTKGKLGQKVITLLSTINKVLSAPLLPDSSLKFSKAYIMVVPTKSPKSLCSRPRNDASAKRSSTECIVGCVITTHIKEAMRIVHVDELEASKTLKSDLVCMDIGSLGNVYCDPDPIPATLGIPRLFVIPSHRRLGISRALLDAAARTAIWGCPLDPTSGQIAFSQPTASGHAVMKDWGGHNIRIYEE
ncbi:hypothetical protein B0J17DRAFT_714655 [Rhizoctonia solani]|nr:hypothetical protein B0J17DRAFT_714655 [Rhizoctonia solani]